MVQFKYPCIKYPCIIWYQTSAAISPMFWFQPRPPPRWPVANGRRITKAVTLKNTINTWKLVLLMSSVLLSLMSSVLLLDLWCHQYYCRIIANISIDFIKKIKMKTHQVAKTATRLVRQLNLSRFYQLAMKFHLRLWAQTAAHLLTARAASIKSRVAKLQNILSWYWYYNHPYRQAVSITWCSKQSWGLHLHDYSPKLSHQNHWKN